MNQVVDEDDDDWKPPSRCKVYCESFFEEFWDAMPLGTIKLPLYQQDNERLNYATDCSKCAGLVSLFVFLAFILFKALSFGQMINSTEAVVLFRGVSDLASENRNVRYYRKEWKVDQAM